MSKSMTGAEFDVLMKSLDHTRTSLGEYWGLHRMTVGRLCNAEVVEPYFADALRYLVVEEAIEQIGVDVSKHSKRARKR
jgi:hypothetical protein